MVWKTLSALVRNSRVDCNVFGATRNKERGLYHSRCSFILMS